MLLDDRVTIATPEGVTLELMLAGVGSRFIARLLDTLIQAVIIIALGLSVGLTSAPGWMDAVVIVLVFLTIFGYDTPFEILNGGRTVGKLAAGIRVVDTLGQPVSFFASAIRNILRIVDFLPVVYVIGVVTMVVTENDQRLGDLAAGTIVVRDHFPGLTGGVSAPATVPVENVATWDVSALTPDDLVTIHTFLDRRLAMPFLVRAHFANELASRVAPKVAGVPYGAHPEYLLEGVVVAKQARS